MNPVTRRTKSGTFGKEIMIDIFALIAALLAFAWLANVLIRRAFVFNFLGMEIVMLREKKPVGYWMGVGFMSLFGSLASLAAFGIL